MRTHQVNRISFRNVSFLIHAIEDDWGVDDVVAAEIRRNSYGEGDALTWWLAIIANAAPRSTAIDVGAYTGFYSLIAAAARSDINIVAIEASVVTFGRLCQNILLNKLETRISPNHVAISDSSGLVKLSHGFGALAMASGESLEPTYQVDHTELVPSLSLDELILQPRDGAVGAIGTKSQSFLPLTGIGGIKIDVEGVEALALKGGLNSLRQFQPPLIIEILSENSYRDCWALLEPLGYERIAICHGLNYVFAASNNKNVILSSYSKISKREGGQLLLKNEHAWQY